VNGKVWIARLIVRTTAALRQRKPTESVEAACRSEARASLGATATMRAPPPNPAPPPRPDNEVELAPVPASNDVSSDSAERLPSPLASQARRRTADERNEMRQLDTRGNREHPPTHRVSGPLEQIRELTNSASDVPLRGVVGRARSDSFAEDPSACYLAMCSSTGAASDEPGAARAGEANLMV
jgi:hypothetical protein